MIHCTTRSREPLNREPATSTGWLFLGNSTWLLASWIRFLTMVAMTIISGGARLRQRSGKSGEKVGVQSGSRWRPPPTPLRYEFSSSPSPPPPPPLMHKSAKPFCLTFGRSLAPPSPLFLRTPESSIPILHLIPLHTNRQLTIPF